MGRIFSKPCIFEQDMKESTVAILLLGLCCFLSIKPPVHGSPVEDAVEEEADAEDGGDDEGQEKLTPVTALMSSTKPKLGAEKCIDGVENGKDSAAADNTNLCHTLVKKRGNQFYRRTKSLVCH